MALEFARGLVVDVNQFVEQLDEKKGKLARWEAEIFALHHAQVSYEKIADFLRLQAVQVCRIEVYRYIHRNKRRHLLQGNPAAKTPVVTPAVPPQPGTATLHEAPCSDAPSTDGTASQPQDNTLPRFSWQESRSRDKPKW